MLFFLLFKDVFTKEESDSKSNRTESVDLGGTSDPNSSDYLKIEISDALHEKDKVKFTVKTKVKIKMYQI